MHRRTPILLNSGTANHYRVGHTRYINPCDVGLAGGNRFDPIFAASALRGAATFATTQKGSAASTAAFSSLPEINDFVNHFTSGNNALHHQQGGSPNAEHRHHGLDAAYDAISRAEEIFTSLVEHQLMEKTNTHFGGSADAQTATPNAAKVSARNISDDIKLQFATIAATKISLLTNHFNHCGSGSSLSAAGTLGGGGAAATTRSAFTDFSHPAMGCRARIKLETEVVLTAVKALALFETPQQIAAATSSCAAASNANVAISASVGLTSVGPKASSMFPFLKEEADGAVNELQTTARDAPTHTGRSELSERIAALTTDAKAGGFLSGALTNQTAASAQLLDTVAYLLTTMTFSLAKLKEIAPDSPLHFDGSQWSVFGTASSSHLTRSEKALRDAMATDAPKFFHLVESFRLVDANAHLRTTIHTYLNMGGSQTAVDAVLGDGELPHAAASVASVLRSSCQQTAARLCVTSGLLRVLLDGNLIESQNDIIRGRKLLMMSYNGGREQTATQTAVAGNPTLQAQYSNATAHAVVGQQLTACPLPLLVAEFGQSLLIKGGGDDGNTSIESSTVLPPSGSVGVGNNNYGKLAGQDFSSIRHLHARVNLFAMMSKNEANKRPVEGGLFMSLNAEVSARKSYGTYGVNEMDGPLANLFDDSIEYYRSRVEDDSKSDTLSLVAGGHSMSAEQRQLLREQRAAEQDHFASVLLAAGNFYLAGTPRPPPKTNKEQDTRIWDQPHVQLAYLQSPLVSAMAGSRDLYTEPVCSSAGLSSAGATPNHLPFDMALKQAQQLLEKALQLTRSSTTNSATDGGSGAVDTTSSDHGSSVYNLKAAYILRSLACVYCEMKDYLYATGLFASAERAFVHHYGQHSAEVLDLLALQETYQRRIGASREGEMTFKKMMGVVAERRKHGVL